MTRRRMILIVCIEHLLSKNPEWNGIILKVTEIEDGRRICKIGNRVFIQILIEACC